MIYDTILALGEFAARACEVDRWQQMSVDMQFLVDR